MDRDAARPTYMIDSITDQGKTVFRVWRTAPDPAENVMLGSYDSLALAKASIAVDWTPPEAPHHEAQGYGEGEVVTADEPEEDYPHN